MISNLIGLKKAYHCNPAYLEPFESKTVAPRVDVEIGVEIRELELYLSNISCWDSSTICIGLGSSSTDFVELEQMRS